MAGSEWSYYVISSANSMKLGILQIDLDLAIFQKTVVGILYRYPTFSTISFRVIDAWYSGFLIIGLLYYYAQDYQGFLYLRYSGSFIAQPRHQQYYSTLFEDLYSRKCRGGLLFSRIESPTYSASYLNWYKFHPCSLLYSIYPLRKLRGRNFL